MPKPSLRVLVLSRAYPNNVTETLGVWARGVTRQVATFAQVKVVAPVPYCPPLPGMPESFARFRRVDRHRWDGAVESIHPRFLLGPGYSTHSIESLLYLAGVSACVRRLRRDFPFDVIHAHFAYPDGVVAAHLGRKYRVPVVITEQNIWGPWMNQYASVCRRAIDAVRSSARVIAISRSVQTTMERFTGPLDNLTIIPDGVDASEFTARPDGVPYVPNQILFVGAVRAVKGVDILLRSIKSLVDRGRDVQLVLVGEAYYTKYRQEEDRLKQMVQELGLAERVRFEGKQPLPDLVRSMQQSAVLVLPSHAESLGMVLIEALACGTPVVATRCGGPEDIVADQVGVLVPPGDADALTAGIEQVLATRHAYDPSRLRAYALEKFGLESVGRRMKAVYEQAVQDRRLPIRAARQAAVSA